MAEIELVIKIPEEIYQKIKEANMIISGRRSGKRFDYTLFNAVVAGTPLPKGHGQLIDVNDLLDDIGLEDNDYNRDVNAGEIITLENIDRIPTIVKADEVGEEE